VPQKKSSPLLFAGPVDCRFGFSLASRMKRLLFSLFLSPCEAELCYHVQRSWAGSRTTIGQLCYFFGCIELTVPKFYFASRLWSSFKPQRVCRLLQTKETGQQWRHSSHWTQTWQAHQAHFWLDIHNHTQHKHTHQQQLHIHSRRHPPPTFTHHRAPRRNLSQTDTYTSPMRTKRDPVTRTVSNKHRASKQVQPGFWSSEVLNG